MRTSVESIRVSFHVGCSPGFEFSHFQIDGCHNSIQPCGSVPQPWDMSKKFKGPSNKVGVFDYHSIWSFKSFFMKFINSMDHHMYPPCSLQKFQKLIVKGIHDNILQLDIIVFTKSIIFIIRMYISYS